MVNRGALTVGLEVSEDVSAGEELAFGIGDIDLDVQGAGAGVDGVGVAGDGAFEDLTGILVEGKGRLAAVVYGGGVGLGDGDVDADAADGRKVEELLRGGVFPGGDERADIDAAGGDDAVEGGVDVLKGLKLLEAADVGLRGVDCGLLRRRRR